VCEKLYSVIFEVRQDEEGEILHLGHTVRRPSYTQKIRKSAKPVAAEEIAKMADRGEDVSRFFRGKGRMVQPIQRVNVDITGGMLEELDKVVLDLNVSRQAVIKTLVRQALDQHYVAQDARRRRPHLDSERQPIGQKIVRGPRPSSAAGRREIRDSSRRN
jgi:hypothetical protein